jgi:single-stranded-DNA-specific exonuclease
MAAGLTIRRESVPEFRRRFAAGVADRLTEENSLPRLKIDAVAGLDEVSLEVAEDLDRLGPFGFGNGRPVLLLRGVSPVARPRVVGRNHLKLSVRRPQDGDVDCIGFELGEREFPAGAADLAGSIAVNVWNGRRTAQFQIADFREAAS